MHLLSQKLESKDRAFRPAGPPVRPFLARDSITIPDYVRQTDIRAVVEVVPAAHGKPQEFLLWNAYRASWRGAIALALNGVTVAEVDRVMDEIVPHFPLNIPGVVYIDAQNKPLLAWVLSKADLIFGQTKEFRLTAPKTATVLMPYLLGEFGFHLSESVPLDLAARFATSIGSRR